MVAVVTKWTARRRRSLAVMIDQGLSYREIARRLGETTSAVRGAAQRYGLMNPSRSTRGPAWSRQEYDTLEALLAEGLLYREIAERMGRPHSAIRHAAYRLGLSHPERQRLKRRHDWEALEPILQTCIEVERMCVPQLAERLVALGHAVTPHAIRYHLRTHHPRLYVEVVANAAARRSRWNAIRARRRHVQARQQRERRTA